MWLVAHERVRTELLTGFPEDCERICFTRDRFLHRFFGHLSRFLPRRLGDAVLGPLTTLLTQWAQRRIIRRLVAERGVNVLHQPTPVAARYPSVLSGLGVPLVIGPMNGGMEYPPAFRSQDSFLIRQLLMLARVGSELSHLVLRGKREASVLLVANARTRSALPRHRRGAVFQLVENGVDLHAWKAAATSAADSPLPRFVFLGRLVDWKCLQFVLQALPSVQQASLDVIGDGPMLAAWQTLADTLGVSDRVRFLGWRPQGECAELLSGATALVLPSIYECGGAVVLEAMALGVPVIATDWGGPADYVDDSCGILVEPAGSSEMVRDFAAAMRKLASDPELCRRMGSAAQHRARTLFSWDKKIDRILEIYRFALGESEAPLPQEPVGASESSAPQLV